MATYTRALRFSFAAFFTLLRFRLRMLRIALSTHPIAGASPDGEGEGESGSDDGGKTGNDDAGTDKAAAAAADDTEDADGEDADDDAGEDKGRQEPDWKRQARKHEREAKRARRERDDFERKLKSREDKDKSEQEKAIEQAGQKARDELQSQHELERQQDRLEVATTKAAARGIKLGSGDKEKTVRFADPDDALLHLERDIRNGDLARDDIFDDKGKVRQDALSEALADILDRKPHLAADHKAGKVGGSADAGKGAAAQTDSSVDDHLKTIRRHSGERQTEGARFRRASA